MAFFPAEILSAHITVYPSASDKNAKYMLQVVQGSIKNEPSESIYHVVYSYKHHSVIESLSVYR